MPYVAADGHPSGATVDVEELATTAGPDNTYSVDRSGTIWNVRYVLPPTPAYLPRDLHAVRVRSSRTAGHRRADDEVADGGR
jgi:hypothetical protein